MSSSNNTKQNLQPKLRFPEFRDVGGWERQPLEKFLDYQQPTPYLVTDTNYSKNYGTPVLTAGKTFLLGYTNEQHGIFKDGLPVIIFDDFTTATQFVDFPFKAKSSAMKILQAKNEASIKFMYEVLQMISYEVGAHERHWISKFAPMLVPVPVEPAEQYRIANCLSSLDDVIAAEGQKVEALKAHKKGLMQELFPAEGETLPKRRFPEFRGALEWKVQALGELGKFIGGGTPSKDNDEHWKGNIPWISSSDVIEDDIYNISINRFITEEAIQESATKIVPEGSILFVSRVGTGKLVVSNKDLCTSQDFTNFISEKLYNYYLAYFFLAKKSALIGLGQGTSIKGFSKNDLENFKVIYPQTEEQHRIADCLSSLDTLITAQSQKLETLRQHKKGLMQQLFPSPEDVEA